MRALNSDDDLGEGSGVPITATKTFMVDTDLRGSLQNRDIF